jgi:hypothetical protein
LNELALRWLLDPSDPSIRYQTLVDILGQSPESKGAVETRRRIPRNPLFKRIMSKQTKAGYWPKKDTCNSPRFTAAIWALTLLGEMALVPDTLVKKECERFFNLHQGEKGSFSYRSKLQGKKHYDEPCLTGNMVRTLLVLGYGKDPRVRRAIEWMPEAQLEDGGWNCDYPQFQNVKVRHSSFMSTIALLWAYSEIPKQGWTRRMKRSIESGAEFLLMHRLYKADHHEWMPMNHTFTTLHFPMYYYYDVLHGLRVLTKLGYGNDERMRDAAHLVMSKRRPDGKWVLEGDWFGEPGASTRWLKPKRGEKSPGPMDPWGNSLAGATKYDIERVGEPSKWITLNCYRALVQTGDLRTSNN